MAKKGDEDTSCFYKHCKKKSSILVTISCISIASSSGWQLQQSKCMYKTMQHHCSYCLYSTVYKWLVNVFSIVFWFDRCLTTTSCKRVRQHLSSEIAALRETLENYYLHGSSTYNLVAGPRVDPVAFIRLALIKKENINAEKVENGFPSPVIAREYRRYYAV